MDTAIVNYTLNVALLEKEGLISWAAYSAILLSSRILRLNGS